MANSLQIEGNGVSAQLPDGWDGRIILPVDDGVFALHAASFALPPVDGEWPGYAVSAMPSGGAILALVEQDPAFAGEGLYASGAIPQNLTVDSFGWGVMPNPQPGRYGAQFFFTVPADRTWVCWIVVDRTSGSESDRLDGLNGVLRSLRIQPSQRSQPVDPAGQVG